MRLLNPLALTCFAIMLDLARMTRAVRTVCLFFQPWKSFLFVTRDAARVSKSFSWMGFVLADFIRPGLKDHKPFSCW